MISFSIGTNRTIGTNGVYLLVMYAGFHNQSPLLTMGQPTMRIVKEIIAKKTETIDSLS